MSLGQLCKQRVVRPLVLIRPCSLPVSEHNISYELGWGTLLKKIYVADARKLAETLQKNGSSLVGIQQNLVDLVWGKDRPAAPRELVKVHPVKYAGKSFQEKISELRKELESRKKAGFVICTATLLSSFASH